MPLKQQMPNSHQSAECAISDNVNVRKVAIVLLAIYIILTVGFYFLAGDQLRFRISRGQIEMPVANSETLELVQGTSVEQMFMLNIQRMERISLKWGDYGRLNTGTVKIELVYKQDGSIRAHQTLSADILKEGYVSTLELNPPLEGLYGVPLSLRITSDSAIGSAPTPLRNTETLSEGYQLYLDGIPTSGMLCFSVHGTDYIWIGIYYWVFVAVGAIFLVFYSMVMLWKEKHGRNTLLLNAVVALKKYRFLIRQLVSRDFKTKYKRSALGVLWSFLNPLLTMFVQYLVFSNLFKFDIPYYPVYLLCGIIMFNFFSEACSMSLMSILGNSALITKVYVPKYIYPLTRTLSSLVNLIMSMIPLFIVSILSGILPTQAYFFLLFELICLTIFCLGIGMLLASAMVFFRDTQFLWGVLSMIWMYLTPIFYPESILPKGIDLVLKINPLYFFIKFTRICIMDGVSPEPIMYIQCLLFALGSLLIGSLVFKKTQDRFVLYL